MRDTILYIQCFFAWDDVKNRLNQRKHGVSFESAARVFEDPEAATYVEQLEEAVKEIGHGVTGVHGDVSSRAYVDKVYAAVQAQKGKLDIVFANAGIGEFAPLGQITEEHFDKQFNVNVKGLLFTVQKELPLMQPGGCIVLNASIVSITGSPAFSV